MQNFLNLVFKYFLKTILVAILVACWRKFSKSSQWTWLFLEDTWKIDWTHIKLFWGIKPHSISLCWKISFCSFHLTLFKRIFRPGSIKDHLAISYFISVNKNIENFIFLVVSIRQWYRSNEDQSQWKEVLV